MDPSFGSSADVPLYSTGCRSPFLNAQRDFGIRRQLRSSNCAVIIQFQSLNPGSEIAIWMERWSKFAVQELCSPPQIMSAPYTWLSAHCSCLGLDTGDDHHGRNPLSDHETPLVERPVVPHTGHGGGPPSSLFTAGTLVAAPSGPSPPTVSSPFVNLQTRQDSSSRNPHQSPSCSMACASHSFPGNVFGEWQCHCE